MSMLPKAMLSAEQIGSVIIDQSEPNGIDTWVDTKIHHSLMDWKYDRIMRFIYKCRLIWQNPNH